MHENERKAVLEGKSLPLNM